MVTVLDIPTLEIDADVDGDGTAETGVFELAPGERQAYSVGGEIRTGYLLQNEFSALSGLLDDVLQTGEKSNKGIHFDAGGGEYALNISFQRPIDATVDGVNLPQWGDGSGSFPGDATGAMHPQVYEQVFTNYLRTGKTDSEIPGRFRFGLINSNGPSGFADALDVVVEQPSITPVAGELAIQVEMTLVATINLNQKIDATANDLP